MKNQNVPTNLKLLLMYKLKRILILIAFVFSYQLGVSQDFGNDKQWMKELITSESKSFLKKYDISSEHTANYDVKFHRLVFNINPAVFKINGEVTTYFVPNTNLDEIKFDFTSVITVDEVNYNNVNINFNQTGNILTCNFPNTVSAGVLDSIKIIYSGVPESGIDAISQKFHNDIPIISTLSEPYGAKDWWPCKQDLIDKADSIEVIISTPIEYKGISNGLQISDINDGITRTSTWKHNYPIPAYLVAIAITNYADYSIDYTNINGEQLPILNHIYPENLEAVKPNLETTKLALNLFETLFEIYPYSKEKYGHAQFPWNGGMEHATVSFMGTFPQDLIAHELAHQWFGDKITCGSWSDIWLNEGFATYLTGLTYEHYKGNFDGWLEGKILDITSSPSGSVYVTDTTSIGSIFSGRLSYSKGAMVLHMLRFKLGDDIFFQSIKNYLNDENLKFSYAKTEDLIHHCEMVSGIDLSKFFDQWIYKEGYPSYSVEWKQNDDKSLLLRINQTQSHSSVSFFEMPVEIKIQGTNGESETIKFDVNTNNFNTTKSIAFDVSTLEFDPNKWLISKDNIVEFNPNLALDNFENDEWSAYFNENILVINSPISKSELAEVKLYDSVGKVCLSKSINISESYEIDTHDLTKGVYYLVVNYGGNSIKKTLLR